MKTTTSITIDAELKQLWDEHGKLALSDFVNRRLKEALITNSLGDGTMLASCIACEAKISTQSQAFNGACFQCNGTRFTLARD